MTEDEAKTKWCPHVRLADSEAATWNRAWSVIKAIFGSHKGETACNCIGSACMAWRWDNYHLQFEPSPTSPGHCGLAGKP